MTTNDFNQENSTTYSTNPRNKKMHRRSSSTLRSFSFGLLGGVVASAGVLTGSHFLNSNTSTTKTTSTVASAPITSTSVASVSTDNSDQTVTNAIAKVQDAIVSISNYQQSNSSGYFSNNLNSTNSSNSLELSGQGSGVIYKVEGDYAYIVTNNHVIDEAVEIEVTLRDNTTIKAELVGTDALTDLAVLKISKEHVTTVAQFADSSQVLAGQTALAIGSPLGSQLASSVTKGIISAVDRSVDVDTNDDDINDWTMVTLQTDAAINPGNSGGALIDLNGNVIGINSMKISDESVEGIGFAIPSNQVVTIITQLEANGKVSRPVLGIRMVDLTNVSSSQRQQRLGLSSDVVNGVVISSVESNSVAQAAGLQKYDVIIAWNGETINNSTALRKALYSQQIGDKVSLKILRNGKEQTLTVTLSQ